MGVCTAVSMVSLLSQLKVDARDMSVSRMDEITHRIQQLKALRS